MNYDIFRKKCEGILKYTPHAFPHSRVRKCYIAETDSLAHYEFKTRDIVLSENLVKGVFGEDIPEERQFGAIRVVAQHEASHSSHTLYWPKTTNPLHGEMANHLEDWRLNRNIVKRYPEALAGFKDSISVIDKIRNSEPPNQDDTQGPDTYMTFRSFWHDLWPQALRAEYFQGIYQSRARKLPPKCRQLAEDIEDLVFAAYDAIPGNISDLREIDECSRVFVRSAHGIIRAVNEAFPMKDNPSRGKNLLEEINRELERREKGSQDPSGQQGAQQDGQGQDASGQQGAQQDGQGQDASGQQGAQQGGQGQDASGQQGAQQGGQGQDASGQQGAQQGGQGQDASGQQGSQQGGQGQDASGQQGSQQGKSGDGTILLDLSDLKTVPTDVLKAIKDILEQKKDTSPVDSQEMTEEQANQSSSRTLDDRNQGGGRSRSEGEHTVGTIDPLPRERVLEWRAKHRTIISQAEKLLANSMDSEERSIGRSREIQSRTGHRLHIGSVARYKDEPSARILPFRRDEPVISTKSRRHIDYDEVFFSIDGSGSMSTGGHWNVVQTITSVLREVCGKNRIRVSAVMNHGNTLFDLCGGRSPTNQDDDIGRVLASLPGGGTDFAVGSFHKIMDEISSRSPDTRRSRLMILSDCLTDNESVEELTNVRGSLPMPSALIVIGSENVHSSLATSMLLDAAQCANTSHSTIRIGSAKDAIAGLNAICQWMRDPKGFGRRHNDGIVECTEIATHLTAIDSRVASNNTIEHQR